MLESLITSKTRIKLLLKFFLDTSQKAYLRGLADEFGESTNAIRLELNHLEKAGLLCSETSSNKKYYHANKQHPLFDDICNLVLKHSGISQIIVQVIIRIGDINKVWIKGSFAEGKDSNLVDLIISGEDIDEVYLETLINKAEKLIKRKIQYIIVCPDDENTYLLDEKVLLIWKK